LATDYVLKDQFLLICKTELRTKFLSFSNEWFDLSGNETLYNTENPGGKQNISLINSCAERIGSYLLLFCFCVFADAQKAKLKI